MKYNTSNNYLVMGFLFSLSRNYCLASGVRQYSSHFRRRGQAVKTVKTDKYRGVLRERGRLPVNPRGRRSLTL